MSSTCDGLKKLVSSSVQIRWETEDFDPKEVNTASDFRVAQGCMKFAWIEMVEYESQACQESS